LADRSRPAAVGQSETRTRKGRWCIGPYFDIKKSSSSSCRINTLPKHPPNLQISPRPTEAFLLYNLAPQRFLIRRLCIRVRCASLYSLELQDLAPSPSSGPYRCSQQRPLTRRSPPRVDCAQHPQESPNCGEQTFTMSYNPQDGKPQVQACRYKTGKTLGAGSYSVVKECVHIDTGRYYAAKVINKRLMAGREHMVYHETF
jgi:hypothetical protein